MLKIIGEGKYGIAYLAQGIDLKKYVLKQLKNEILEATRKKLFYEEEILKKLKDNRFPKFIEKFDHESNLIYVLEYIEGKDFEDILNEDEYEFSKEEIYNIAIQLIDIVEILQKNNIIHRDLRTPNIILDKNNKLKLIDFGLARYIDDKKYVKEIDYWYIADFLVHLYYSSCYKESNLGERPWFEELDLNEKECLFLKKLMGIEGFYKSIDEIKKNFKDVIN
ncbi:protein kinase domain-containing protein [Romboutsia lituseburensis]|uniref:protein kinase domain-containing protein n=1 Tax=Romboutsia lituseburensis TaxID=1537 RepID=UPI00215A99EF|nr:protein kinase [Romboutsia lituseburensis]MCR8743940.1 protein kinase [Romboutsia lituseburensis]